MSKTTSNADRQSPEAIASTLSDLGWLEVPRADNSWKTTRSDDRSKARCFRSPRAGRYLYLKVKPGDHASPKSWPIVLSPVHADLARRVETSGIKFKARWDHGTMYGRLPTRVHRGKRDIPYGIALEASDVASLRAFLIKFDLPSTEGSRARRTGAA